MFKRRDRLLSAGSYPKGKITRASFSKSEHQLYSTVFIPSIVPEGAKLPAEEIISKSVSRSSAGFSANGS